MINMENNIRVILKKIGEDPDREGLLDTPRRVAKMYSEIFSGYKEDPKEILSKTFPTDGFQEMVIVKDIEFYSCCEHHMAPFYGTVSIGYIPSNRIVGLSKLARLVECYAKRLQVQERITECIANDIMEYLSADGVMVVVKAEHMCMKMRGVRNQNSSTVTSAVRGLFFADGNARKEFLDLIK